jgi:hypothetical protein
MVNMLHNHRPVPIESLRSCWSCKYRNLVRDENTVVIRCDNQDRNTGPGEICDEYYGRNARVFLVEIIEGSKYSLSPSLLHTLIRDDSLSLTGKDIIVEEMNQ